MEEKFRNYLDLLFSDAPKTTKILELKEELLSNLIDKYNGFVARGISSDEAYEAVKNSIGDIDSLIYEASGENKKDQHKKIEEMRRKNAVLKTIAVMLYILCPVPLIALSVFGNPIAGLFCLFAVVAIATGLMVYRKNAYCSYQRLDDTVVEEFREWKAEKNKPKNKIVDIMWMIITIIYFIVSFATMAWYITWIIFVIGAVLAKIIELLMDNK